MVIVGVGTDLIEVDRMRQTIERTPSFVRRVFTEAEQAYASEAREPAGRYAARWAAKEAVAKAFGTGVSGFGLLDLEIGRDENGRPSVTFHGAAADKAAELGVERVELSLTHSETLAGAIAVAIGPDPS